MPPNLQLPVKIAVYLPLNECCILTGNDKYINSLFNNGNFDINNPKNYGYKSYKFPVSR